MKLKDKRIEIQESQCVSDKYGNRIKQLVTIATVWAISGSFPEMRFTE